MMVEAQSVCGLSREALDVAKPLHGTGFYVKPSCTMRFGSDPEIPAGASANAVYWEAVQPFNFLPLDS